MESDLPYCGPKPAMLGYQVSVYLLGDISAVGYLCLCATYLSSAYAHVSTSPPASQHLGRDHCADTLPISFLQPGFTNPLTEVEGSKLRARGVASDRSI
jgi:hypothetical protein